MKNSIRVGLASIMLAAGVAQTHAAAAAAGTNWDRNVTFQLTSQSASAKKTIKTSDIISDLNGATAVVIVPSNVTASATVTNPAELALGPSQTNSAGAPTYTNATTITNTVQLTFTNGAPATNVVIISTQTATNPFTYSVPNISVTISNETHTTFSKNASSSNTNLPAGTLIAVLTTNTGGAANNGIWTVSITNTTLTTNVFKVPALDPKKNKLVVRLPSPSATATNDEKWIVRSASGSKATDVADVTPFFSQTDRVKVTTTKGNGSSEYTDFDFVYRGPLRFDLRGNGKEDIGTVKGASQRKNFNSTVVGGTTTDVVVSNSNPAVISGKYNLTGGVLE